MLARRMTQKSAMPVAEEYSGRVSLGHSVLDIGQNVGALIIYTDAEHCGKEIEVSLKGDDVQRTHTEVLKRKVNAHITYAALFVALKEGDYDIWSIPGQSITILGGSVAEVDWRGANVVLAPKLGHSHRYNEAIVDILPP